MYTLRPMTTTDIAPVVDVLDCLCSSDPASITFSAIQMGLARDRYMRNPRRCAIWRTKLVEYLADEQPGMLVAEMYGHRIGFLVAVVTRPYDAGACYGTLEAVGVLPTYRRQGIATALMQAALERLIDAGIATVLLDAGAQNELAHAWAGRLGFRPLSTVFMADTRAVHEHLQHAIEGDD
jgi:ribosomal protein S18 acetylase RimI-like enzyme